MNDEKLVHDVVRQLSDEQNTSKEWQKVGDTVKSHPAESNRSKGVYNDIDTKLKGDGFQEWPKYTDSIKQREL